MLYDWFRNPMRLTRLGTPTCLSNVVVTLPTRRKPVNPLPASWELIKKNEKEKKKKIFHPTRPAE